MNYKVKLQTKFHNYKKIENSKKTTFTPCSSNTIISIFFMFNDCWHYNAAIFTLGTAIAIWFTFLFLPNFLNKSKKILSLSNNYQNNKNIDLTISLAKPPIFWKDKEIIKQQIFKWSPNNIKLLIYQIIELELLIKRNTIINPINLISNFILEQSSATTSN